MVPVKLPTNPLSYIVLVLYRSVPELQYMYRYSRPEPMNLFGGFVGGPSASCGMLVRSSPHIDR